MTRTCRMWRTAATVLILLVNAASIPAAPVLRIDLRAIPQAARQRALNAALFDLWSKNWHGGLRFAGINPLKRILDAGADPNATATLYGVNGVTPLICAIRGGNLDSVRVLQRYGANVNCHDHHGESPVVVTADCSAVDCLVFLHDHGAKLKARDKHALNAALFKLWWTDSQYNVHFAGSNNELKRFLAAGADANAVDVATSEPPLLMAMDAGDMDGVRILQRYGANVNWQGSNSNGTTPVMMAAEFSWFRCLRFLLEHGAKAEAKDGSYYGTALTWAATNCSVNCLRLLLDHGANVHIADNNGETPLIDALNGNNPPFGCVKLLVDHGADVNAKRTGDGITALMLAAERDRPGCVSLLLDHGAKIEAKDDGNQTALAYATTSLNLDCARVLLDRHANVEANTGVFGDTPLTYVLGYRRGYSPTALGLVTLLVDRGANVNARMGYNGRTALMLAVSNGAPPNVVRLLLVHGANVAATNMYHETALTDAACNCDVDCSRLLLDYHANVNVRDADGDTPLMDALGNYPPLGCVRLFVGRGADVNAVNNLGKTALMLAALQGRPRCVRLLLSRGAFVDATDNRGWTALQYARSFDHPDRFLTIPFLQRYRIPIHYAHHNQDVVKALLAAGATDPEASNRAHVIAAIIVILAMLILAPLAMSKRNRHHHRTADRIPA